MAPKGPKVKEPEVILDEEAQKALDESTRLQKLCYNHGIIAKARRMDSDKSGLKLPSRLDGKDIVKKGNMRKNRYLLNIPAQLSALTAGKMGSLAQLDTRNPVLYIDFQEGRLKFKGTLFFPKNKYMTLRLAQKEVRCEDIFESLIVFSEYCWIGSKEENPEEHPLPMPSTLPLAPEPEEKKATQQTVEMTQEQAVQTQETAAEKEPVVRSSQRKRKQSQYTDASSESEKQEDSDDDTDQGPLKRAKKPRSAGKGPGKKGKTGHNVSDDDIVQLDSSDSDKEAKEEETDEDSLQVVTASQRSQPIRSARPKKSLAPILEESSGQEDEVEDPDDDSDFGD